MPRGGLWGGDVGGDLQQVSVLSSLSSSDTSYRSSESRPPSWFSTSPARLGDRLCRLAPALKLSTTIHWLQIDVRYLSHRL